MTYHVVSQIADELKSQMKMNQKGWLTVGRPDLTNLLRTHSGKSTARLGSQVARDLEVALATQGIVVIPGLNNKEGYVRLVWAGTTVGQLHELLTHPSAGSDIRLAHIVTKIKGRWGREAA
jgi:hypothetical protein